MESKIAQQIMEVTKQEIETWNQVLSQLREIYSKSLPARVRKYPISLDRFCKGISAIGQAESAIREFILEIEKELEQ